MSELTCAWVRDRLPEHVRDALDVADAARLEQHLAACEFCSAEFAVVYALAVPIPVPDGVEARVLEAVASRRPAGRNGTATIRQYAVAASFVFVAVTGSLLWQQFGSSTPASPVDVEVETALVLPAGADPLLHESGLQSLSEEELRTLLEELES